MRCKILYKDISKILKLVLTSLINRTKIFSQTIIRKKKKEVKSCSVCLLISLKYSTKCM